MIIRWIEECRTIEDEEEIRWLRADVLELPWVRCTTVECLTRTRGPGRQWPPHVFKLLGYAVLKPGTPRSGYGWERRLFYLKEHDYPLSGEGPYSPQEGPYEAVIPRLVKAGASAQSARLYVLVTLPAYRGDAASGAALHRCPASSGAGGV